MAKASKKAAPATEAEPATAAIDPTDPWNRVGTVPLADGTIYLGFVNGCQLEVLHRKGELFADNGGSFSRRVDGVSHVRERLADPT